MALGTALLFAPRAADAQTVSALQGKRVGVYLSKKNFRFGYEFNQTFAGILQVEDSLGLSEEALQTGMTIWLGNYLARTLVEHVGCRDAYFINSRPELANAMVKALESPDFQFSALKPLLPAGTDYVLLLDAARFRKEAKRTYLTYSNNFYTLARKATAATVSLRLYAVKTGTKAGQCETSFDSETPAPVRKFIPLEADHNAGLALWNRLLDDGIYKLTRNLKDE
jgi:hypothetical protein